MSVSGLPGVSSSGLWSCGAGGLASLACPGTSRVPGNTGLVQIVSVPSSPMRVSFLALGFVGRDVRVWAMVVMEYGDEDHVVAEVYDGWEAT